MFEYVYDVLPYQIALLRYLTAFKPKAKHNVYGGHTASADSVAPTSQVRASTVLLLLII